MTNDLTKNNIAALSEAIQVMTADLSLDRVLQGLAEIAAKLVNARYAALGLPNKEGGMEQFLTYGMPKHDISKMDHYPLGLGLLGLLISRPETIRLENMSEDERSSGFPGHHPMMKTFLGVPIMSKGKHLGSLYLCDRLDDLPFSQEDEELIEMLAGHAAIAIENASLSEQLQKLAVIEERDRISMELHDGIIQSIYAIGMRLELLRSELQGQSSGQEQINQINNDLNSIIEDLRTYIQNLRVGVDYSVSLHEQIAELCEGFRQVSDARLVMDVAQGFVQLTEGHLHCLTQVIREMLSNIARHANASEVYLDLRETSSQITLVVSDNGDGFEVNAVGNGNGLNNINQRVWRLNGTVNITSHKGRGTTVTVILPI